jgi:hypothetical protein
MTQAELVNIEKDVASELTRSENQRLDVAFHHLTHALTRKSFGRDLVVAVHHPEYCARRNATAARQISRAHTGAVAAEAG